MRRFVFQPDLDPPAIHLQGLGSVLAKPAKDFKVGDYTLWNQGYNELILAIVPKGKTLLTWAIRSESGVEGTRVVRADRLVAIGHAPRSFSRS